MVGSAYKLHEVSLTPYMHGWLCLYKLHEVSLTWLILGWFCIQTTWSETGWTLVWLGIQTAWSESNSEHNCLALDTDCVD